MKNLLAIILLFFVAGCSVPKNDISIYLIKEGKIVEAKRDLPTNEKPINTAIHKLLLGPSDAESASGISSAIPEFTRARRVDEMGDMAVIDLNDSFADINDVSSAKLAITQIVFTATSIKGIDRVLIKLAGAEKYELAGGKMIVDHPFERKDLQP